MTELQWGGRCSQSSYSGLGTGISASAFIKHGISTDIVEIDPAVYDAATEYFGLEVAEPDKVHIMDGRSFVMRQKHTRAEAPANEKSDEGLFDFVIHDLFSGGGVPGHLFTLRFWQDLVQIIKPDAVVAVVSYSLPETNYDEIHTDSVRISPGSCNPTRPRPST